MDSATHIARRFVSASILVAWIIVLVPRSQALAQASTVNVLAQGGWTSTSLYLRSGDRIAITASGSWKAASSEPAVGPNGAPSRTSADNFLNVQDIGVCSFCARTSGPHWESLIGFIGDSPPAAGSYSSTDVASKARQLFYVGSHFSSYAPSTGTLWLAFNDDAYSGYTADNSGQVRATVQLTPLNGTTHSLGAQASTVPNGVSPAASYFAQEAGPGSDSVDLSAWVPAVGYQDGVGSCTAWATGYYYRYWLRQHSGINSELFAPMYTYSQISKGQDKGSSPDQNFTIQQQQGLDTHSDYTQGDYNFTSQPTPAERLSASQYKIASHTRIFSGQSQQGTEAAIRATMQAGHPVALTIPVYDNFDAANSSSPFVDEPSLASQVKGPRGWHAVFAPRYDSSGVWIENSWGTDWGLNGWAELSWAFVDHYAGEGWYATSQENLIPGSYFDNFSSYSQGMPPKGWSLRGTSGVTPTIVEYGPGTGPAYQWLSFPEVAWQYWDKWALKDQIIASAPYTVTVKMRFLSSVADRAGLTIGWKDDVWNRIDIQPNVYWDDIEFHTRLDGTSGSLSVSGPASQNGGLPIDANQDYWLRVQATVGQINVFWSTDGVNFNQVLTATGSALSAAALTGQIGVGTAGPHMPQVLFDDFKLDR